MALSHEGPALDDAIGRTVNLLGGPEMIGVEVRTALDAHDLISKGLQVGALNHLVMQVRLLRGGGDLLEAAVGMSLRTLQRRRDELQKPLNIEQSGRTWKFAEVLGRAEELLGSRESAEEWMKKPQMGLDRRRPIDLLSTPAGVEALEDHLTRLEYGAYA
ncbi:MAG: antitoxin Xre/MbcA/ParS toxin-binding domain-containing protein [Pseudomonadota bacterium]